MSNTLLPFGLVLHISGITLMAGTFFAGFLTNRQLWKHLSYDRDQALSIARATSRFRLAQAAGGLLIIAGGITMMLAVHGVFMHQTWFKLKMSILGLLIANMFAIERPAAKRLKQILYSEKQPEPPILASTQRQLRIFHLTQLALFLAIFIISAYKFN